MLELWAASGVQELNCRSSNGVLRNFFAAVSNSVSCSITAVWTSVEKKQVCRFSSSFINTVTWEKPVHPDSGNLILQAMSKADYNPLCRRPLCYFLQTWVRHIFWGCSLEPVTTVQYDKFRRLFWFCFVSISFLIPGYIMPNFLLGKIFHDIPLKYSTTGIKYLL